MASSWKVPPAKRFPERRLGDPISQNEHEPMATKTTNRTGRPRVANNKQSFSITAPAAMSVTLMGDFAQWQGRPISLTKQEGGVWRVSVERGPGTRHHRCLVDGEWRDDPECTLRVPHPSGSESWVCQVL
jgi:1,4-alpha-glucan branching enzyme